MKRIVLLQFVVYLSSGLILGGLTYSSMMWGVWGAPVHWTDYVALLGSFAVLAASILSFKDTRVGRTTAVIGLISLGFLWIPGVISLIPQHNVTVSPLAYASYALYFAALGIALFYPTTSKMGTVIFIAMVCCSAAIAGVTTIERIQDGEYKRPSFGYFRWHPGNDSLVVEGDSDHWLDPKAQILLKTAGVKGILEWKGSSGDPSSSPRVILIASTNPPSNFNLHYPRAGDLIYVFDGSAWRKIPDAAPTFSSYATLEPEKGATMLWQNVGVGRQGTTAFSW